MIITISLASLTCYFSENINWGVLFLPPFPNPDPDISDQKSLS